MKTIQRQLSDINGNALPQGAEINGFGIDFGNGGIKVVAALTLGGGESAFFRIKLQGLESLPSKVVFMPDGKVLIGIEAVNAERLGKACSNLIGKDSLDNPDDVYVILEDRSFTSVEVLSIFMQELKALFLDELGIDVTEYPVGMSYPANFNASQRECLGNILETAGFNIVSQQEEPIQALRSVLGEIPQGKLLVIDIGGGTSDISLQECSSQDIRILATGACSVAGIDFKNVLAQRIIESEYDGETPNDPFQMAEVSACANQALHDLTSNQSTSIALIASGLEVCEISRQEFENDAQSLLDTIEKEIHGVIDASDISIDQIDGIFLTGGGSLIPCVRERISTICFAEQYVTETPLHDVALGNAIHMYQSLQ